MPVLIDIEWTEARMLNQAHYHKLTQISALRVSSTWKAQARLDLLVRPETPAECDWDFMGYNGHTPEEFCTGKHEGDCIRELFGWLKKGETMFCWYQDSKNVLLEVYRRYIKDKDSLFGDIRFVCLRDCVEPVLKEQKLSSSGFYGAAKNCGADVPTEHCSSLDTELLRIILCKIKKPPSVLVKAPAKNVAAAQRKVKNQSIIAKAGYKFVYSPDSKVFHRCGCKIVLNAVTLHGCIYYRTAARNRCPCKVCKPVPSADEAAKIERAEDVKVQADPNEVVKVRLIDGSIIPIKRKNIVGVCHSKIHPGRLNEKLMNEHNCQGKQCHYFEKYANASYWIWKSVRQMEKQYIRHQRQDRRDKENAEFKALNELKCNFQKFMDAAGYTVQIVRLELIKTNVYKVFYVSDNAFADGRLYPNFYAAVFGHYPHCRLVMRHIKDIDGHFVTREEYRQRMRQK